MEISLNVVDQLIIECLCDDPEYPYQCQRFTTHEHWDAINASPSLMEAFLAGIQAEYDAWYAYMTA
jgi:hypothetical protein